MRNLKKILALVLALVMSLSLVTMASADYSDAAAIDNDEAVAVMSAIGVLQGSDGKFDPDGILTREQAAKIITYMLLGKEKADKLTTVIAPFADVEATRWSAGAIAYCADQGILAGVGNGNFAPTAKLTGLQFAKMVLCALGYDAAIEGLTGDTWAIKVATLAVDLGLDKDVSVDLSKELSRENAAQMAFNAFAKLLVRYQGGTTVELPGGTKVVVGATRYNVYDDNGAAVTFMDKYVTDKLVKDTSVDEPDAFGRPAAYEWEFDGKVIYTAAAKVTKTYAGEVKASKVWEDLGKFTGTINATVKENGAAGTPVAVKKAAPDTAKFGGDNTAVEVYYDATAKTITVVEIAYQVGTVKDVKADKVDKYGDVTEKAHITLNEVASKKYETTAFAKNDVVLYALVSGEIKDVKLAESFTGKVSAIKGGKVTIDGAVYTDLTSPALAVGAEGTYYKGVCGAIVKAEATKTTSDNWALVYNVQTKTTEETKNDDGYTVAGGSTKYAYVVLADGTKASYVIDADNTAAMAWAIGDVVCYEINADGEIKAATAGDTNAVSSSTTVAFGKDTAVLEGKYTNAETDFVFSYVKQEAGKPDVHETKVVTGYKNIVADTAKVHVVFDTETNKALTVFVEKTVKAAVSEVKDYYILLDAAYTETAENDKPVYTYDVYVNGAATTLSSGEKLFEGKTAGQIFTVKLTDGKVAAAADVTFVTAKAGTVSALVDDYAVLTGANAGTYYFTADAQIYLEKTEDGVYSVSKDALAKDDVLRFITVSGGDDDGKICFALITRAE